MNPKKPKQVAGELPPVTQVGAELGEVQLQMTKLIAEQNKIFARAAQIANELNELRFKKQELRMRLEVLADSDTLSD